MNESRWLYFTNHDGCWHITPALNEGMEAFCGAKPEGVGYPASIMRWSMNSPRDVCEQCVAVVQSAKVETLTHLT